MSGDQRRLILWQESVRPEWIDYNGHLSEAYYVLVFGHATDAVMDRIGIDAQHRTTYDASLYTIEAHVRYLAEVPADSQLEIRSSVIGASDKIVHLWHEMWVEGRLRATEEILGVYVVGGGSAALPAEVAAEVDALTVPPGPEAHRSIRRLGS